MFVGILPEYFCGIPQGIILIVRLLSKNALEIYRLLYDLASTYMSSALPLKDMPLGT